MHVYVCVHGEGDILKNTLDTRDRFPEGAQAAGLPKAGDDKDLLCPVPVSASGGTFPKPPPLCPSSCWLKTWCIM